MGPPPELSRENLRAYWACAVLLLWVDVVALFYLARRAYQVRRKALVLRSFATLLLGDVCFVAAYLPHHTHNLIGWLVHHKGTGVEAARDSLECRAVSTLLVISFALMCGGVPLASFQPYFLVNASFTFSTQWAVRPRAVLATVLLCTTIGAAVVAASFRDGMMGQYRGLYCGMRSYGSWQTGGLMVAYASVCAALATTGFVMTRRVMKKAKQSAVALGYLVRTSRTIQSLSLKVTVVLWVCLTPLALSGLVGTFGETMPEWFEMLSGLLVKLKVLVDVVVLLSLPIFQRTERQRTASLGDPPEKKLSGVAMWGTQRTHHSEQASTPQEASGSSARGFHWIAWEEGEVAPSLCVV